MKILKWFLRPRFSYFEIFGILIISEIARNYSDWYLLLYVPLFFTNRFINGLLPSEEEIPESVTYNFDTVDESAKFFANNIKNIKAKSVETHIKELSNKFNS